MQAGLPHRTRCRPLIIHLAPKASTDQLSPRPATQNRTKAACAPPAPPASRDSPLASPPEQSRPVALTLDRLGWGKPTNPPVRPWGRGLPRRGAEGPREAAIIPLALRRALILGGARGRGPEGPAHPDLARRPIQRGKAFEPHRRGPEDPQCDKKLVCTSRLSLSPSTADVEFPRHLCVSIIEVRILLRNLIT